MTDPTGERFPAGILHAILIGLDDRTWYGRGPKRGLAACSLVCHHWAVHIRPMLFSRLRLRSAEDVAQLLAFVRAPTVVGQPLQTLIRSVVIEEYQAGRDVPWGHQVLHRLAPYFPTDSWPNIDWTIRGAPASSPIERARTRRQSWHSVMPLPRTPPSRHPSVTCVTLSNLQLPSADVLASFVKHHGSLPQLWLENVTFVKDTPARAVHLPHTLQHNQGRNRSLDNCIRVDDCVRDAESLKFWLVLANTLLAAQRSFHLNDGALALVARCFECLFTLHTQKGVSTGLDVADRPELQITVNHSSARPTHSEAKFILRKICELEIWCANGAKNAFGITNIQVICPALNSDACPPFFEHVEKLLLADHAWSACSVCFRCNKMHTSKTVLQSVLEGRSLVLLREWSDRSFVFTYNLKRLSLAEILAVPEEVVIDGQTLTLDTVQRVEYLIRREGQLRELYLRELLRTASSVPAAASPV